ncbi:MAG TPA: helix-turn-helix transcriptional regulator [Candidatus Acidoferrum sp.]|nr:helix-turn-helix transcriptional regulator [Candidatus Acidoferrum sp.]
MTSYEFKSARLDKGWNQTQAAAKLGVSQAHLNCLEHGKRRLTPQLVRRAAVVYGLSPDVLPTSEAFTPGPVDDQRLTEMLARLNYPGFADLATKTQEKNPSEFLLTALSQQSLDARVAAALPWVVLRFAKADSWLVENARKFNLQNRLGFVVTLARRIAESQNNPRLSELRRLEEALDESRLVKEDFLPRPPHTENEKEWLRSNRTDDAAHWNLLTRMRPEHLQYVS